MSNWDKDLIGLIEKSDTVPARGEPVKPDRIKYKTFTAFILSGLLLSGIIGFYYLSNQSWFVGYFVKSHNNYSQSTPRPVRKMSLEAVQSAKEVATNKEQTSKIVQYD